MIIILMILIDWQIFLFGNAVNHSHLIKFEIRQSHFTHDAMRFELHTATMTLVWTFAVFPDTSEFNQVDVITEIKSCLYLTVFHLQSELDKASMRHTRVTDD